ncbi:hypothetical protein M2475_001937 [Breznakia sp. PF5-3]|nr:hypothetical protein [Breznakia sp. PM6-1]MDF9836357.1 hypothetical protein [Breznakia sp. PF5-3]MDF9838937.1 hypothetical protein [Breznakia sp. PFB2-8]MDF9860955.1 hypothetical protein [Breznakia sp. PH5-24]
MLTFVLINIIYWLIAFLIYKMRISKDKNSRLIFNDFDFYDKLSKPQQDDFWNKSNQLVKKLLISLGVVINLPFIVDIVITDNTLFVFIILLSYVLFIVWYLYEYKKLKNTFSFRK